MKRKLPKFASEKDEAAYWDQHGVLNAIEEGEVTWSLEESLQRAIRSGKRAHRLKNLTIKIDPLFVQAIRKIAAQRAIPYQTLIRSWLAKDIKEELKAA